MTEKEALEKASPTLRMKMHKSLKLLHKAASLALQYDSTDGYYLAFSGGKDSQALYHIALLSGERFKAHMNLTSIDPPEVIRFVKNQYPEVHLIKPKESIYKIAEKLGILPTMRKRWCCQEYKEMAGAGKVTLIGIRHAESFRRSKRNEVEILNHKFSGSFEELEEYRETQRVKRALRKSRKTEGVNIINASEELSVGCIHGKESIIISPIIDWTEQDVWEFLNKVVETSHCILYDQGFKRIGCIGCPMSSFKHKQYENIRWPHVKRNWIKAIMRIRANGGLRKHTYIGPKKNGSDNLSTNHARTEGNVFELTQQPPDIDETDFEIATNIYDWWISGKSYEKWYAYTFLQTKLHFSD